MTTNQRQARQMLTRRTLTEQRTVLATDQRRPDTVPSNHVRDFLAADPTVVVVWDEDGTPYYGEAERVARLAAVAPHRVEADGSLVFPVHIARTN